LSLPSLYVRHLVYALPIWILVKIVVFRVGKLDRGWWQYVSVTDLVRVGFGNLIGSALSFVLILLIAPKGFPRSIYLLDLMICFLSTSGIRLAVRMAAERASRMPHATAAFAAWCSAVVAAVLVAGELALSGTAPWAVVFPAMVDVHLLIGLGEAAVTVLVVVAIQRTRPELVDPSAPAAGSLSHRQIFAYGLLISIGLALFVSPFACAWPDGLERVAARLGFAHRAVTQPMVAAPLADYRLPWIRSAPLATSLAGAAGTVIVFILAFVVAGIVAGSGSRPQQDRRREAP